MTKVKKETTLFSAQITKQERDMFEEVAGSVNQTKAAWLRQVIRQEHKKLGKKA